MVLTAWVVIFLLGCVAQSFILSERIISGLFVYMAIGSFAVILIYGWRPLDSRIPYNGQTSSIAPRFKILQWTALSFALLALGCAIYFMTAGTANRASDPTGLSYALYFWMAALGIIALTAYSETWRDIKAYPKRDLVPLAVLILLALAIGLFRLTDVPPTVHGDEGMVGIHARKILQGHVSTFFSTSWYSIPQFFFFLPACSLYIFGDTLFGLRMGTVLLGVLSVVPFYFLAREWWGTRAALLAGLVLISNHWFVHLMHCGVNYVQASFFAIALLAFLFYSNARRSLPLLFLCGAVMGLSLLSYQANHLLPFLWIASQSCLFFLKRIPFRWFAVSTLVPITIALLTIAPLIVHDYQKSQHTEIFSARSSGVVIWTPQNSAHVNSVYRANGDSSLILREQIKRALLSTILYTDKSIQFNGEKPFLDRFSAVLFMLGIVIGGYRFFEPKHAIPILWIVCILLAGGALTVDAPFYPRLAGATALLFLPIAGVFSSFLSKQTLSIISPTFIAGAFLVLLTAAVNLHQYFSVYANVDSPKSVHYAQTQMAKYIQTLDPNEKIYVIDGPHFSFNSGTVQFLAPSKHGYDITDNLSQIPSNEDCTIAIDPGRADVIPTLQERFPTYTIHERKSPNGQWVFTTLTRD